MLLSSVCPGNLMLDDVNLGQFYLMLCPVIAHEQGSYFTELGDIAPQCSNYIDIIVLLQIFLIYLFHQVP